MAGTFLSEPNVPCRNNELLVISVALALVVFQSTEAQFSQTQEIELRNKAGIITSPNYPRNYKNGQTIRWKIVSSTPMDFVLNLISYDIEDSPGCKNDYLRVSRVYRYSPQTVEPVVCGSDVKSNETTIHWDLPASYSVEVEFKADSSVSSKGFKIEYTTSEVYLPSLCKSMRAGGLVQGTISTNLLGDYRRLPANLNCSWDLLVPDGQGLEVSVNPFQLEYFNDRCLKDRFIILAEGENTTEEVGTFCGRRDPWSFVVKNKTLVRLILVTDSADNSGYFSLNFYQHFESEEDKIEPLFHITLYGEQKDVLPLNPEWLDNHWTNVIYRWHLQTEPGYRIRINASRDMTITLPDGVIVFYDGPNTDVIDRYQFDFNSQLEWTSSGFHVVLSINLPDPIYLPSLRITYEVFNFFLTSDVVFRYLDSGDYTFVQNPSRIFRCCVYHALVVRHDKTVAFNLLNRGLFDNMPNDQNCSRSGVVVYMGGFRWNQTIGPVCDTTEDRLYKFFNNFVASSSTVYIVLYGYTNGPGRTRYQYELDPWSTTCSARHINEAVFKQPSNQLTIFQAPDFNISRPSPSNFTVTLSTTNVGCLLLYVHPLHDSEPAINLKVDPEQTPSVLCQRWTMLDTVRNDTLLLTDESKYLQEWSCRQSKHEASYSLNGSNVSKWSQRIARLAVGDVLSFLCAQTPSCSGQQMWPTAPCGLILHDQSPCTWILRSLDPVPYYWSIEILILRPKQEHRDLTCFLEVMERFHGLKSRMTTSFPCIEMNSGRLRRYRSMEPFSSMTLGNKNTLIFKLRYSKKYFKAKEIDRTMPNETLCENNSLPFGNYCYKFTRSTAPISWQEAEEICQAQGGSLISILTSSELKFIKKALAVDWNDQFFRQPLGKLFIGLTNLAKGGEHWWTDGNPLSFSDWYNRWDRDNNIFSSNPKLGLDRELSQPLPFPNLRCTAMVIGNVYFSTNWVKIDCNVKIREASYICKTLNLEQRILKSLSEMNPSPSELNETSSDIYNGTTGSVSHETLTIETNIRHCPSGWTIVSNTCLKLLSEDISILEETPRAKVEPMCSDAGGTVASIDTISSATLKYYFLLWGVKIGYGNVWVKRNGRLACTSLSTLLQEINGYTSSNGCILDEGRTGFVLCERTTVISTPECNSRQFTCSDGLCIHDVEVCDGRNHCQGGEDEANCNEVPDDFYFKCKNGNFISLSQRCDFIADCDDESDEDGCYHVPCSHNEYSCVNRQCIPVELRCDFKSDCLDGSDEMDCDWGVDMCKGYMCPGGKCLPKSRLYDIIPDCPDRNTADESTEENSRLTFFVRRGQKMELKDDYSALCHVSNTSRRCHENHRKCFDRSEVCIYDKDEYGDLVSCRDGAHLIDCEDFVCPHMFKCPDSYCIPWYRVCDGVRDCPIGTDEVACGGYSCPGHMRCEGSNQCIPQGNICDGRVHCKHSWSDERYCDLAYVWCPEECLCSGYNVDCRARNLFAVPQNISVSVRGLLLSENTLSLNNSSFSGLAYLYVLRLSSSKITDIPKGTFADQMNVHILDLRFNEIKVLHSDMFEGLISLTDLLLDGNLFRILPGLVFRGLNSMSVLNISAVGIQTVQRDAMKGMPELRELDLSDNNISKLEPDSLKVEKRLSSIYLNGNDLRETTKDVIEQIWVEDLWTDSFRYCCFVRSKVQKCHPDTDLFSSCEDLLSTPILRALVWFLGIACVLGNTIVICWRIYSGFNNRPSVYVINLSLSDLLMGICLLILASTDLFYRGNYILYDLEWRLGGVCKLIGMLSMVSCQMSMFTLVALAFDRFVTVKFPFAISVKSTFGAWIIMVILWVISILIAVVPFILPLVFDGFYGNTSICFPLNFTEPKIKGWEYSFAIFVGLDGVCLIIIVALYAVIYCRVRDSQLTVGRTDRSDLVVARRLSIVLVTNIISWIPIIIASILSITSAPLTREMTTILTTVILPLNPTINPYLYTFSSCIKRDDQSKKVKKLPYSVKSTETHL